MLKINVGKSLSAH